MIAFGLTTNGVLYANGRQLARSCTSFIVTEAHLIFTSSDHLLKFVHLSDAVESSFKISNDRFSYANKR